MSKEKSICWGPNCKEVIEVQLCCSGQMCGCQGLPVDPPFCSDECFEAYLKTKQKPEVPQAPFDLKKYNTMYKAIQNNKFYLAVNRFPKTAKTPPYNNAYLNGFRKWRSEDMTTYAIVIGTFRIMFGIKRQTYDCCG